MINLLVMRFDGSDEVELRWEEVGLKAEFISISRVTKLSQSLVRPLPFSSPRDALCLSAFDETNMGERPKRLPWEFDGSLMEV